MQPSYGSGLLLPQRGLAKAVWLQCHHQCCALGRQQGDHAEAGAVCGSLWYFIVFCLCWEAEQKWEQATEQRTQQAGLSWSKGAQKGTEEWELFRTQPPDLGSLDCRMCHPPLRDKPCRGPAGIVTPPSSNGTWPVTRLQENHPASHGPHSSGLVSTAEKMESRLSPWEAGTGRFHMRHSQIGSISTSPRHSPLRARKGFL